MSDSTNKRFMERFRERLKLRGAQMDRVYFGENVRVVFSKTDGPYVAETSREFAYEFYNTASDQMEIMATDVAAELNEMLRKKKAMSIQESYLGDGLYARYDGYQVALMANSHIDPTDTVYLNDDTWDALVRFVERVKR